MTLKYMYETSLVDWKRTKATFLPTIKIMPSQYNFRPAYILSVDYNQPDIYKERASLIYTLFDIWTAAGMNTHHAKDPFNCKAVMNITSRDNSHILDADYIPLWS